MYLDFKTYFPEILSFELIMKIKKKIINTFVHPKDFTGFSRGPTRQSRADPVKCCSAAVPA